VPGNKIIDASYVKTPFNELNPVDPSQDFGLMIACDGYSMDRGLHEFWDMVVSNNVKYVTAFNEGFGGSNRNWFDVYRYFPDEQEKSLNVGTKYKVVNLVNKIKKTSSMTTRTL